MNGTTRNTELEIGPHWPGRTRRNLRVDASVAGCGLLRSCGLGFWTIVEPNQTVFLVQTRTAGRLPGHVANTTHGISGLAAGGACQQNEVLTKITIG